MSSVRPAGPGFFPLGEELALLPKHISPYLHQCIVRLGTLLPFEQVPALLHFLTGVQVSAETVRRLTEEAGAAQVALEQQDLEAVEQSSPPEPAGPAVQQVSADGAMVPLLHGEWAEARTLAIGTIEQRRTQAGEQEPHTTDLSYLSRLCSAETFIRLATLPTHERGTRRAGTVVAVMDGAAWLQELIDEQCPAAVRILDFPHAVEYLGKAAQAGFGSGTREAAVWLEEWVPKLKKDGPEEVLAALRRLPTTTPEAVTVRRTALCYLQHRQHQLAYPTFQEAGYPIGSGIVESACKLVVEQRLKGSGMHWKRANVSPMLALRGIHCSQRWETAWPRILGYLQAHVQQRRHARWQNRHPPPAPPPPPARPATTEPTQPKRVVDGHPTADHPWHDPDPLPNAWAWRGTANL